MIVGDANNCPFGVSVINPTVTAAGTTQATATKLDALTSIVVTVPSGSGVQIVRPPRYRQIVVNGGANSLLVYPRPGQALNPSPPDTPISLQPGRTLGLIVQNDSEAFVVFETSSFA